MNARHLAVLAVVAVVAVAAALYSTSLRGPQTGAVDDGGMLVPGLKDAINDVSAIRIAGAGDQTVVSLERGDARWTVAEKGGYPADTGSIRELLLALADARLRESKTANPDNYAFLEVRDIASPEASGVQISLTGVDSAPVIVGKAAAGGGEGTYVRRAGDSQSWLASGSIDVTRVAVDWLDRDIINFPASRLQSVTVRHADGEELRISRQERSAPTFDVEAVPEGRELSSAEIAEPMGSVLQGLRLDDVQPAGAVTMNDVTTTEYRTFDGLVISVQTGAGENSEAQVMLRVAFDEALARQFVAPVEDFETVAGEAPEGPQGEVSFTAAEE
ncbi:MAG: DUF4340 domain-containing protein, partial [Pseudomonadota bacterium]